MIDAHDYPFTSFNKFLQKCKALSDERVVPVTENEYRSAVKHLYSLLKLSNSISDEWLVAIC